MSALRCVVECRDLLGETPLWCSATGVLWWIDIERPRLQSFNPDTGRHDVYPLEASFLGCLAFRRSGGFLIGLDSALHVFDPERGTLSLFAQVEPVDRHNRLNDGRCDCRGRFWVGSMDVDVSRPSGSFYRVDPDGTVKWLFNDIIVTNSVAIAPDQRTLYMSDTRRYVMWAFDLDVDDGVLSNRRVFVEYKDGAARPDGACVDSEGCIWNAIFAGGRVVRYSPDGRIDRTIAVPTTNPTCVCFGGPNLETLFITTCTKFLSPEQLAREPLAGALFAVDVGVKGLPEELFAG